MTLRRRELTLEESKGEFRASIATYEDRYGCTSGDMLEAVRSGKAEETMEVARWLFDYRALASLEAYPGRTTGIRTTII